MNHGVSGTFSFLSKNVQQVVIFAIKKLCKHVKLLNKFLLPGCRTNLRLQMDGQWIKVQERDQFALESIYLVVIIFLEIRLQSQKNSRTYQIIIGY